MLLLRFKPLRMHYIAIVGIFWWIASLSITLGNGEQNTPFTRTGEIEGCNFWDSPFTADGTRIITSKVDEVRVWDTGSLKPTTKWLHHGKVLWMQLRHCMHLLLAVFVPQILGCHPDSTTDRAIPRAQPTTIVVQDSTLESSYFSLANDISTYNGSPPRLGAWVMNSEHLFLGADDISQRESLRQRSIRFSRQPDGLNFLFAKLSSPGISANDVLVITEILVFYGQCEMEGDEKFKAPAAYQVQEALQRGEFDKFDRIFESPIVDRLRSATARAIANTPKQ